MARKLYDVLGENRWADSRVDILDVPASPTWTLVGELNPTLKNGSAYTVALSLTMTMADTNDSALFRFSIDGGSSWEEFSKEAKDANDRVTADYFFPVTGAGVPFHVILEVSKTSGGNTLDVHYANLVIKRES